MFFDMVNTAQYCTIHIRWNDLIWLGLFKLIRIDFKDTFIFAVYHWSLDWPFDWHIVMSLVKHCGYK